MLCSRRGPWLGLGSDENGPARRPCCHRGTVAENEGWELIALDRRKKPSRKRVVRWDSLSSEEQRQRISRRTIEALARRGALHLVCNRHESFVAAEVARMLASVGRFITQQVGTGNDDDLYRLLGLPPPQSARPWNLGVAAEQVQAAGLAVGECGAGEEIYWFADVGALVWYLKAVPWAVAGLYPCDPPSSPGRAARAHRRRRAVAGRPAALLAGGGQAGCLRIRASNPVPVIPLVIPPGTTRPDWSVLAGRPS
jgi:hypothetical protein